MHTYILRYGELTLKGKNRSRFDNILKQNILGFLDLNNYKYKFLMDRNRVFIDSEDEINGLENIFGIVSYSKASSMPISLEIIKKQVLNIIKNENVKSFAIDTKRGTRIDGMNSVQINCGVGQYIVDNLGLKVDLKSPEITIFLEIWDKAYIFTKKIKCMGGLPLGVQGKALGLFDSDKTIYAAWLMMKRGTNIIPIFFDDCVLSKYSTNFQKYVMLNDINELKSCIGSLKSEYVAGSLVVCDTLEDLHDYDLDINILRPLIGISEPDIKAFFLMQ